MPFSNTPRPEILKSLADVKLIPFWMDDRQRPEPASMLTEAINADLCVIGAGFTGLWSALLAKESDPALEVVLIEAGEVASGASGRNGGFTDHCLTHTFENGLERWPNELPMLVKMGYKNLDAIEETVRRYQIECDFQRTGEMVVATEPYQVEELRSRPKEAAPYGLNLQWFDQEQTRALVNSPTYLGGLYDPGLVLLNPAQLAWGLRRACMENGVRLFERTQATGLSEEANGIVVSTQYGQVKAKKVALATNAFPPLLKRLKYYIVPVYDYALMTEPLTKAQRNSIGWEKRMGVGDAGNQFHYYRTSADGRILWGGYDAVYYWNNGFGSNRETNHRVFCAAGRPFLPDLPAIGRDSFHARLGRRH